jgi:hypothetical protein
VTAQPHANVRFRRAIERRALWMAEDAARELPNLPLEDALQLVHLYFERGSPKAEPAARRWLVRYLSEGTPSLRDVAKVTASLAERDLEVGGLNENSPRRLLERHGDAHVGRDSLSRHVGRS